jgi:diguanylate cyclase (GGDEF)-like protein/PAS domain S-box-containing protein
MFNTDKCLNELSNRGNILFFRLKTEAGYPFAWLSPNSLKVIEHTDTDTENGLCLTDMVYRDDRFEVLSALEDSVKSSDITSLTSDFRITCGSGRIIHVHAFFSIERGTSGETDCVCGYMSDTSEDSETSSRLETILSTMPGGLIEMDIDCVIKTANKAIQDIYGYSVEELTGQRFSLLLEDQSGGFVMDNFRMAAQTEALPTRFTHRHKRKNGDQVYVELAWDYIRDSKQRIKGFICSITDVTERKKYEDELVKYRKHLESLVEKRTQELNNVNKQLMNEIDERIEKERQLLLAASVIENTIEGITITDCFGNILQVNPAFTLITGFEPEEVIGKTPRILKSDKHDEQFYHNMWDSLIKKGTWSGEIWNRRKNGDAYPEWLSINAIRDELNNITHFVAVFHDISEVKQGEEKLKYQANHDTLTGLPNRQLFNDRLDMAIAFAKRHNQKIAVIFIDLDNFKNVNDTMGHYVGDILLQKVAEILKSCVRLEDTVARLGGDEFMLILQDIAKESNAVETSRRILTEFAKPINIHGNEFFINASLGITIYPDDGEDVLTMVKNADLAMYRVKETGKNGYQMFTKNMNEKVQSRVNMERELRKAVLADDFEVVYQPKVSVQTGMITGAEALIRWNKDGQIISPLEFIPVAEETGHIIAIGKSVLTKACRDAVKWHKAGFKDIDVAVNLSARQFRDESLIDTVCGVVQSSGIPPQSLGLEITENTMMEDIQTTIIALAHLVQQGIKISIDDFGTGYSSLSYLKLFPIHVLKVDRQFIKDIPEDTDDIAISTAIINLAKGLNLQVIAEGVETQAQLDFCREKGCDGIQGFYFSKPLTCEDFISLLKSGKKLI